MYDKQSPYTVKHSQLKYSPISEKSMQSSHYIQEIASFQANPTCYHHTNDYISHMCFDCNHLCLCGTCLKEGHHRTHDIKNIQKSFKTVGLILDEHSIRLRSNSDILTLLNESLSERKSQMYEDFCKYKKSVQEKFTYLLKTIAQKKQQILLQLKAEQESYFLKIDECSKKMTQLTKTSINLLTSISQDVPKLQPTALCLFYQNRKSIIEDVLSQKTLDKLKQSIPYVKLQFDSNDFQFIAEKIRLINVFSGNKIYQSISPKRMMKKKSIKNLAKTVVRNDKPRQSFPINGTETPKDTKCVDSHKNILKFFRSPNSKNLRRGVSSGKLMSMPASPEKQKMSKKPSPSKGEDFKKKVRKNKK